MKRVWKCNYCLRIGVDKEVVAPHEKNCYLNPANKKCSTCKKHWPATGNASGADECDDGISIEDVFDIQEDDIPCDKWERR